MEGCFPPLLFITVPITLPSFSYIYIGLQSFPKELSSCPWEGISWSDIVKLQSANGSWLLNVGLSVGW